MLTLANFLKNRCFSAPLSFFIKVFPTIILLSTSLSLFAVEEMSIVEPTQLTKIASDESVSTVVIQSPTSIASNDSSVKIALVESTIPDGTRLAGVRIQLSNNAESDIVYLDIDQATQLQSEFLSLIMWYERSSPCDARRCIQGVSRCRPSRTEPQALCPGFYSTSDGKKGVLVSTYSKAFYFPSLEISKITDVLGNVIEELRNQ